MKLNQNSFSDHHTPLEQDDDLRMKPSFSADPSIAGLIYVKILASILERALFQPFIKGIKFLVYQLHPDYSKTVGTMHTSAHPCVDKKGIKILCIFFCYDRIVVWM